MLKREKFIPPTRDEVLIWEFFVPARRDEVFIWEFFISLIAEIPSRRDKWWDHINTL
jgi:hypothetical protein